MQTYHPSKSAVRLFQIHGKEVQSIDAVKHRRERALRYKRQLKVGIGLQQTAHDWHTHGHVPHRGKSDHEDMATCAQWYQFFWR
jgi:hypothetical protein